MIKTDKQHNVLCSEKTVLPDSSYSLSENKGRINFSNNIHNSMTTKRMITINTYPKANFCTTQQVFTIERGLLFRILNHDGTLWSHSLPQLNQVFSSAYHNTATEICCGKKDLSE